MQIHSILVSLIVFSPIYAFSQRALGLQLFYNVPVGGLSEFYSPAPGAEVSFLQMDEDEQWPFEYGIGITRFRPKASSFDLALVQGKTNVVVSDFWFLPLWVGLRRVFDLKNGIRPYVGVAAGWHYHYMTIKLKSPGSQSSDGAGGGKIGIVPKIGFTKMLNGRWHLVIDCRYNYTISSEDGYNIIPQRNLGYIDNYLSFGGGVAYSFHN